MSFVLKRVDGGSHRASAKWTRHYIHHKGNWSAACGAVVSIYPGSNATEDAPSVQGTVRNCKKCWSIMRLAQPDYNSVQRQY